LRTRYGYEADTRKVVNELPTICQCFIMSATLSNDVRELQKLVLHNPVTVDISDEEHGTAARLAQYYIRCPEKDKYLLLYTLLKLRVVPGKALIFVKDVDDCFRLKLLLDRFSIAAAALDSSLPQNSRISVVEAFNRGIYDYLIATDASTEEIMTKDSDTPDVEAAAAGEAASNGKKKKKKQKKSVAKTEYNTARGLDFQSVSAVINFDLPADAASYKHR
jgi:ATP-dependent RNA helicase DDX56/DBP9